MNFNNHPLGYPRTYVATLAKRHSDTGFVLAQLRREYGPHHGIDRATVDRIRASFRAEITDVKARFEREEAAAIAEASPIRPRSERSLRRERRAAQKAALEAAATAPALPPPCKTKALTAADIIAAVARLYGVTEDDLTGKCRLRKYMVPRMVAQTILFLRGNSMADIARRFGGRDHTTVRSLLQRFEIVADAEMRAFVARFVEGA